MILYLVIGQGVAIILLGFSIWKLIDRVRVLENKLGV